MHFYNLIIVIFLKILERYRKPLQMRLRLKNMRNLTRIEQSSFDDFDKFIENNNLKR